MQADQLIQVDTFCVWHNVEVPFIQTLHEYGLIEITTREDKDFIPASDLHHLERLIRLHNDLQINLEGVEAITYLLDRINEQQKEIGLLQNKLRFYET
ncbi:MAG: chaperone modulator CbpM [Ferruginibacter sp.]